MTLAREALRLATVRALRGNTWGTVKDSEAGSIDDVAAEAPAPVIAVYTDDGKMAGADGGLFGSSTQTLIIEIGLTQKMKIDGEEVAFSDIETDPSRELAVGLIERQVRAALSDPTNAWAEIWKKLITERGEIASVRGTLMRDGVRFAGRQLQLTVSLIRDPAPGAAVSGVWQTFLAALAAEPGSEAVATAMTAAIAGNAGAWPGWQKLAASYGYTSGEAVSLGLAPPANVQPDEPAFSGQDPSIDDEGVSVAPSSEA